MILGSLLTTFEVRYILEAAGGAVSKIDFSLQLNCKIKLSLMSKSLIHTAYIVYKKTMNHIKNHEEKQKDNMPLATDNQNGK